MNKEVCYLFFHINPIKQEIFNVGIASSPYRPYSKSGRNRWWHNTVNKYGYLIVVIHENLTWNEACILEIKYIAQIGRRDKGLGPLVNMTDGGEGNYGKITSVETRKKISISKKGIKNSESQNLKISISLQGNKRALGYKPSAINLKNLKDSLKDKPWSEKRRLAEKGNSGRPKTEEQKKHHSQMMKGKPWSEKRRLAQTPKTKQHVNK